ncbi:helix-turn-helix domain-containing protein [Raoultibacter massiliensis]|uniref:Helix-turn-helix transcriptional regulator n=1 Tax=Raoultibacter massiliensis TaxID=1852371 RepID=A0ABV1JAI1_9ACTN|nr:helix-turn-helix transcriptional regulator [Raoultibacter massiliensis]
MPIILRLDRIMADRKISLNELSDKVGISNVNMSRIKTGKIKAIRFSTLEMICKTLECQPGDILEYVPNGKGITVSEDADPLLENTE